MDIISENLISTAQSAESKVFYHKMSGDYHRYLAEFKKAEARDEAVGSARGRHLLTTITNLLVFTFFAHTTGKQITFNGTITTITPKELAHNRITLPSLE